jgi:hypothetical protein
VQAHGPGEHSQPHCTRPAQTEKTRSATSTGKRLEADWDNGYLVHMLEYPDALSLFVLIVLFTGLTYFRFGFNLRTIG